MGRAPCCDKANVKKGPWSPEEDQKLKDHIQTHGTGGNWITLPQKAGLKRCGKSCRLRWLNYLRPNIKHGGFSNDEDKLICTLFASIGGRWSLMAAQLPGRTDNDIKNYWNTKLKKKMMNNLISMPEVRKPPSPYMYSSNASKYHDPVLQSQGGKDSSTLVRFGGDQASSSSMSDGSFHHEYGGSTHVGVYDYAKMGNLSDSYNDFGRNYEKEKGYYGDSSLDSSLEEIRQLISTNNIDNYLNFFVDDTK